MSCHDCFAARAVPDDVQGGYHACPGCVLEAIATFVCFEAEEADPET